MAQREVTIMMTPRNSEVEVATAYLSFIFLGFYKRGSQAQLPSSISHSVTSVLYLISKTSPCEIFVSHFQLLDYGMICWTLLLSLSSSEMYTSSE